MKVKCIYNKGLEKWLTIGKTYEVIVRDDEVTINIITWYCIIDDIGEKNWYIIELFRPLSEIRNEKINKLLEDDSKSINVSCLKNY